MIKMSEAKLRRETIRNKRDEQENVKRRRKLGRRERKRGSV